MYNSNYEDYMRNVLGYNIIPQDTYQINNSIYEIQARNIDSIESEGLYPEIYNVIYPMIQKACMKVGNVVNEEIIEKMTEEVYRAIEDDDKKAEDNLKRNIDFKNSQNIRKTEEIRHKNYMLRDLIKILILRELFGSRPPMRPPMPPPMPHIPPRPPMRPPRY